MNNDKIKYVLIGFLAGAFIVWFYFSNTSFTSTFGMMNFRSNSAFNRQNLNTIDSHFIEQMIPHHKDAITMSRLALTKARKQEVRQLAEDIIESQGREIDQMRGWYREWFEKEVPEDSRVMGRHGMGQGSRMHMGMMGDESDMTRLEQSTDFDRDFVEEMIPHHQMAVMMATMLKNGTQRPEMKVLADDIIAAQTSEIEQMRSWLKDWSK